MKNFNWILQYFYHHNKCICVNNQSLKLVKRNTKKRFWLWFAGKLKYVE